MKSKVLRIALFVLFCSAVVSSGLRAQACPDPCVPNPALCGYAWNGPMTLIEQIGTNCYFAVTFCWRDISTGEGGIPYQREFIVTGVEEVDYGTSDCDESNTANLISQAIAAFKSDVRVMLWVDPCGQQQHTQRATVTQAACWKVIPPGAPGYPNYTVSGATTGNFYSPCDGTSWCRRTCDVCMVSANPFTVLETNCTWQQFGEGTCQTGTRWTDGGCWALPCTQ